MKDNGPDKVLPPETAEGPGNQLVQKNTEPTTAEIEEFVRDAPPEVHTMIRGMMMSSSSMSRPPHHPLIDKFNPAHVDKFLDYNEADSQRDYRFANWGRLYQLGYVLIALAFMVFLIIYVLPNNKDIFSDILKFLLGIAGGFGLGLSFKQRQSR